MSNQRVRPVRNSSGALNPAGIILKSNPVAEQRAFAAPKWLRPRRRGIVSNGVNSSGLFFERMIKSISLSMEAENNPLL